MIAEGCNDGRAIGQAAILRLLLPLALAGVLLAGCGVASPPGTWPPPAAGAPPVAPSPLPSLPAGEKPSPPPATPDFPPSSSPAAPVEDPIAELLTEAEEINPGRQALAVARELLGAPYAFGGSSPGGFDCSGLIRYIFGQVGVGLPRTSSEQYRCVEPIAIDQLEAGNLVFFRISRERISHVGIYDADGLFIHAPSIGKKVSHASLRDPYWRKRLVGAGRIAR